MGDQTRFFWKKWRTRFRICRICIHLLILALVCFVFYLNQIGLPDFIKQPLITALHQHNIELQFIRMRLNFIHGIVADNVRIGGETPDSPSLSLQEVQLQLNFKALMGRRLQLDGVVLRQGKFTLPVPSVTNEPSCTLTFDHIQTDLRFETNDVWSLDNFQANFAGARFVLSGELRNAQSITNLEFFHHKNTAGGTAQIRWEKIASALNEIHFYKGSQLSLNVNGDASDIHSFLVLLTVNAPGANTPWGSARNVRVVAHSIASAQKPGVISAFPREIDWKAQLAQLKSEKLDADFIFCAGFWSAPELQITNLFARLGGGELRASAKFDMATRKFSFTDSSCFDLQAVTNFLTEKTRERLGQFSLPQPPGLQASGSLILPDWVNHTPDWRGEVQPTVRLDGEMAVTNASFGGVALEEIRARFSYSNEVWTLPEAVIKRPESCLNIEGTENDATKDYQWHISGALSPNFIEPFLTTKKAKRGFNYFKFAEPVHLDTQIHGRLYDYDSITANGHAALTNFSIRGESIDSVETDFRYANRVAEFLHPHLLAGAQVMHADGVRLDWPRDRIYFTNGLGTANPQNVANAIGPVVAQVMHPYHFSALPTAHVNGYAPLRDSTNADLDFKVVGTAPLGWAMLKTPAITGEIHWVGETLILTNMSAAFYGGTGNANAFFDFPPHQGANFSFTIDLENVNLHLVATDLKSSENHLEGRVGGHFVVTSGSSLDWRSCNGYGHIVLHDGLLWDVPIFGILSPILDTITPGLGNSRATDASAQFIMTNGVISSDALDVHTAMMRLHYNGTVDLQGRLNAYVTAELLRDVPGIGQVVNFLTSPVTKIFEYKITGTWKKPVSKPVYIPILLMDILHPLHTLENWLPQGTNAPVNMPKQKP